MPNWPKKRVVTKSAKNVRFVLTQLSKLSKGDAMVGWEMYNSGHFRKKFNKIENLIENEITVNFKDWFSRNLKHE